MQIPADKKFHAQCIISRKFLWQYCRAKSPDFYTNDTPYLKEICDEMQAFLTNDDELLVVNLPPRYGKSRTATNAAQWYFGVDDTLKIMTGSYNSILSRTFSKQTRNGIAEKKVDKYRIVYSDVFPGTQLQRGDSSVDMWRLENSNQTNYLATSPTSSATGFGADIIIIDDIIKNKYEAYNERIMDGHFEWFTDTMFSRLEGKRKVLIIMTRWSTKDLAGRVLELYAKENRKYKLISKQAWDGQTYLNEKILNEKTYNQLINTIGEDIVEANYNQNPVDKKGRLYDYLLTYKQDEDVKFVGIYAYCDTADTGEDFLCNIIYGRTRNRKAYILDVYYTQARMEITELETAKRLTEYQVTIWRPESNNGGRGFARAVERIYRTMGNDYTICKWYSQNLNKEARILANSTSVMKNIYFPEQWDKMYPQFYKEVTNYQRTGKNMHDDGVDVLSEIANSLVSITGIQGA